MVKPASQQQLPSQALVLPDTTSLIALSALARRLPLKATKVRSQMSGAYNSPFKGRGMEFDESRPYQPGDEVRNLDWRIMARSGKAHTKLFREERERPVLICVDDRMAMNFATQGMFKRVMAARAASLLAWSAAAHGDRLGGVIFSEQAHQEQRPGRGKKAVLQWIQRLVNHHQLTGSEKMEPDSAFRDALARLRRVAKPGSLIFLISDFRHMDQQSQRHLQHLSRHHDLVALYIYDVIEQSLPVAGIYPVCPADQEHLQRQLDTRDRKRRLEYAAQFEQRVDNMKLLCRRLHIHFIACATDDDLLTQLQKGLGMKIGVGAA